MMTFWISFQALKNATPDEYFSKYNQEPKMLPIS